MQQYKKRIRISEKHKYKPPKYKIGKTYVKDGHYYCNVYWWEEDYRFNKLGPWHF